MGLVAVREMLSGDPLRHPQVWGGRLTSSRTSLEGQVWHSFPGGVVKAAGYVVGAVREPPGHEACNGLAVAVKRATVLCAASARWSAEPGQVAG